jgi:hypothetical protein
MRRYLAPLLLIGLGTSALAQIGLPQTGPVVGGVVETIGGTVDRTLERTRDLDLTAPVRSVAQLARDRVQRIQRLVRANPERIELDDQGEPARRGIVLLLDADATSLDAARKLGFTARTVDGLDELGLGAAELITPAGMPLARALRQLRGALPGKTLSADVLHFEGASAARASSGGAKVIGRPISTAVGVIDGGVGPAVSVIEQTGFATGAPSPSDHGTAVAGLLRDAGVRSLYAADVYGRDPAGGGALAIARALNWLAGKKVRVVSMSLVGPRNPLLERALATLSGRGTVILAAVGNDGPSAPPAYPASYPAVLAITGVDGRNRALIEAGRALHLDYAAPGADIRALNAKGAARSVRGTSFAVPMAAARAAAAIDVSRAVRPTLDAEARDLGRKGPDNQFGRGLLCGGCGRR